MGSVFDKLLEEGLIKPPPYLKNNVMYETIMGSEAYGCNMGVKSDIDIYGFAIPTKEIVFPHTAGHIFNFGKDLIPPRFDQFQKEHINSEDGKEYDIAIYNIVKYFQLCMENNPNMIDSLFTPRRCVIHSSQIAEHVRENRKLFLHAGSYFKFKGYSYSQLEQMKGKSVKLWIDWCKENDHDPREAPVKLESMKGNVFIYGRKLYKKCTQGGKMSKRLEDIEKNGYSTKFAYHLVRLLDEAMQILTEHDIDLERNREQLKSIRRGEWSIERVEEYFQTYEKNLSTAYAETKLRKRPDEVALRNLLLECLEMHFGSLHEVTKVTNEAELKLEKIKQIINERN